MRTCSLVAKYQCSKASNSPPPSRQNSSPEHGGSRSSKIPVPYLPHHSHWCQNLKISLISLITIHHISMSVTNDILEYQSNKHPSQQFLTLIGKFNYLPCAYFSRVLPSNWHHNNPSLCPLSQQLKFPCIGPIHKSLPWAGSPPDAIETHVTLLPILYNITNMRQATTSTDGSAWEATFQSKNLCHGVLICWQQCHSPWCQTN